MEENRATATEVLVAVPLACQLGKQTIRKRWGIKAITLILQLDDTVEAANNFADALSEAVNEIKQEKTND